MEGGYDLPAICDSAEECVRALLGDEPRQLSHDELHRAPNQNAVDTLQKTIAIQVQSAEPIVNPLHKVTQFQVYSLL